jgi:hypothetical protein
MRERERDVALVIYSAAAAISNIISVAMKV